MERLVVAVCLAVGVAGAGCSSPVSDEYLRYAQMTYDGATFSELGVGDRFSVRVYREEGMSGEYTVNSEGFIVFPLIGRVEVLGRTCDDLQREITDRLAADYVRSPAVTCQVFEVNSLRIVVSGEVASPGRYAYTSNLTIVEAVAAAQGLTDDAAMDRVTVTRDVDGVSTEIVVPLKQIMNGRAPNFALWPGDIVHIPSFRILP